MAIVVIYLFEVVDVEHDDAEPLERTIFDLLFEGFGGSRIGGAVLDLGKAILIGEFL